MNIRQPATSEWGLPDVSLGHREAAAASAYRPTPIQRPPQVDAWNTRQDEQDVFSQMNNNDMNYFLPRLSQQVQREAILRRNNAMMESQARLEECCEEYRQLEKERKQTEAELARHNLGKKIRCVWFICLFVVKKSVIVPENSSVYLGKTSDQ